MLSIRTSLTSKCILAVVFCIWSSNYAKAVLYTGSGTSGFGGAVGGSTMNWTDDGTTITVDFTKGAGNFSDNFVLYLDTGASGRNTIGTQVNDRADANRSSITYMESSTGKTLTFPLSFEATHAIAINASFGGLWSISPTGSVGNNGLGFIAGVGNPTTPTDASFTFSFNVADLGLTPSSGAQIDFVGTYLNPFGESNSLGFASNEGYGSGFGATNIGQEDFTFAGSPESYITAVPEPSAFLFGGLICGVLGANHVRKRRATLGGELVSPLPSDQI
ncbi:hypothetical protein [Adhaeretor mobilis]|uniref:PEP-CTERM protein-sorting domain-containing protein n=1 Tax=Adhaeretor mobilis TaxID=1930276 RepID=A0A517MVH3_9BACT|nr:hypothetical protein [Adhaeretor mobilis]QDS98880.1 hypothetical protein HG15A2_21670 [Adhaeretor mobilis]